MATDEGAGASRQQPLLVLGKIAEILDALLSRPSMTLVRSSRPLDYPVSPVQRLVMVARNDCWIAGDQIWVGARMAFWAATA